MLKENMVKILNEQIKKEFEAAFLYLSMSANFSQQSLSGFAHWMRKQALEEQKHAFKIYDYLLGQGAKVELLALEKPPHEWASPLITFRAVYGHEKGITIAINRIMALAKQEQDYATENFLQWFVKEQIEEEASAAEIVAKLEMAGESKGGWLMLDHKLSKRE